MATGNNHLSADHSSLCPGRLLFLRYQLASELHVNRFGIPEPRLDIRTLVPLAELDLILTPLVAFDAQGNRMGMGGGFYDRTLAAAQQSARTVPLLAVGFAHTLQLVDSLPLAPWDIPLPLSLRRTSCIASTL